MDLHRRDDLCNMPCCGNRMYPLFLPLLIRCNLLTMRLSDAKDLGPTGWAGRLSIPTTGLFPRLRQFPSFDIWKGLWGVAGLFRGYFKWFFMLAEGEDRLPGGDLTFCVLQQWFPGKPAEFFPNEEELCFRVSAEFTKNSPVFLPITWKTSSLRACMGSSEQQLIPSPCPQGAHHKPAYGTFCPGAAWSLQALLPQVTMRSSAIAVNSGSSRSFDWSPKSLSKSDLPLILLKRPSQSPLVPVEEEFGMCRQLFSSRKGWDRSPPLLVPIPMPQSPLYTVNSLCSPL